MRPRASDRVAGLILAGGASQRMGRPKALLEHAGRTFVEAGVDTLRAGGCSFALVVDGAHRLDWSLLVCEQVGFGPSCHGGTAELLPGMLPHSGRATRLGLVEAVEIVHNAAWSLGPLSSMQVGLRAALVREPALAGLLVHHVERPRVRPETIAALLAAFAEQPDVLWQPTHVGRSGHPMLWPRSLFDALLALDPAHETARTLVRGRAAGLRRKLEVDDPGVLDNVDTPEDLVRLTRDPLV